MLDDTQIRAIIRQELDRFNAGFEDRLARAIQKGMDVVVAETHERLQAIEEDLARLLKHTGLS